MTLVKNNATNKETNRMLANRVIHIMLALLGTAITIGLALATGLVFLDQKFHWAAVGGCGWVAAGWLTTRMIGHIHGE